MPYGDVSLEDLVLSQKGNKNKGLVRDALAKYLADTQREQNIKDRSFLEARDPNVFNPPSKNKVGLLSAGRGQKPHMGVYDPNPLETQWNTVKDAASFAKDYPGAATLGMLLGIEQSPLKLIGSIAERSPWGDKTTQNRLSGWYLNKVKQGLNNRTSNRDGSYNDMMDRIKQYQMEQNVVEGTRPEFTSDTTLGDVVDVASWLTPGSAFKAGAKGASLLAKAGKLTGEFSKQYPKLATAGAAAAGVGAIGAYELSNPEEANALSGENFISFINTGKTTLKRSMADSVNSRARKLFRMAGISADEARIKGLYEPVSNSELALKAKRAFAANKDYANSLSGSSDKNDWVILHPPGSSLGRGGVHNSKSVEWGSKILNDIDEAMQRKGVLAKNWNEVLSWAIKNDPRYTGYSIDKLAAELGANHLI